MKKSITLLFLFIGLNAFNQVYPGNKKFKKHAGFNHKRLKRKNAFYTPNKSTQRIDLLGYVGPSFGQENLIGFPKLGGICKINFLKNSRPFNDIFEGSGFYLGAHGSMVVFFAGAFAAGVDTGFKFGPITIDNSLTRLILNSPSGGIVAKQTSYNPKLGCVLGPVWLKFGPSFVLKGDNILRDSFGMENFPYNAEVLFIGKI